MSFEKKPEIIEKRTFSNETLRSNIDVVRVFTVADQSHLRTDILKLRVCESASIW